MNTIGSILLVRIKLGLPVSVCIKTEIKEN